jgi:hypothetical protein
MVVMNRNEIFRFLELVSQRYPQPAELYLIGGGARTAMNKPHR